MSGLSVTFDTVAVCGFELDFDNNYEKGPTHDKTDLVTVVTLLATTAAGAAAVFAFVFVWMSFVQQQHTYESLISNNSMKKIALTSRRKAARFFSTISSLRGFWMCAAGLSLSLLTTADAANPPTCTNMDGTGAAFSPDLCIADGMLPRSDTLYMMNHACDGSTCKTSDCCVTSDVVTKINTDDETNVASNIMIEKKEEKKFLHRGLNSAGAKKRSLHSDDKSVCFYPGQSNGGQSGSTGNDVIASDSFYIYIGSNHGSMSGECFDANENQGRVDVQMSMGGGSATTVWSRNPDPGTAPTINGALSNQVNLIDSTNLDGSWSTTVSPDGKHVYAVACYSNSIVWWQRDSTTGALTNQVNLRDDSNLVYPLGVKVSPDGKNVYAVARSNAVVYWDRDSTTGALTNQRSQTDDTNGVGQSGKEQRLLETLWSIAISPDGKNVYVTTLNCPTYTALGCVISWQRDTTTGALSNQVNQCHTILQGARGVTVSPDGEYVYAAAYDQSIVCGWQRDSTTGVIINPNCLNNGDLSGVQSITVSPDGKNAYAAVGPSNSIVYWDRSLTTGALSNQVKLTDSTNLGIAFLVVVSPDGASVYAVARGTDSIVRWDRDSTTGALTNQNNLIDSTNLNEVRGVVVSPDGKHVYATGLSSKSLVSWTRGPTPSASDRSDIKIYTGGTSNSAETPEVIPNSQISIVDSSNTYEPRDHPLDYPWGPNNDFDISAYPSDQTLKNYCDKTLDGIKGCGNDACKLWPSGVNTYANTYPNEAFLTYDLGSSRTITSVTIWNDDRSALCASQITGFDLSFSNSPNSGFTTVAQPRIGQITRTGYISCSKAVWGGCYHGSQHESRSDALYPGNCKQTVSNQCTTETVNGVSYVGTPDTITTAVTGVNSARYWKLDIPDDQCVRHSHQCCPATCADGRMYPPYCNIEDVGGGTFTAGSVSVYDTNWNCGFTEIEFSAPAAAVSGNSPCGDLDIGETIYQYGPIPLVENADYEATIYNFGCDSNAVMKTLKWSVKPGKKF